MATQPLCTSFSRRASGSSLALFAVFTSSSLSCRMKQREKKQTNTMPGDTKRGRSTSPRRTGPASPAKRGSAPVRDTPPPSPRKAVTGTSPRKRSSSSSLVAPQPAPQPVAAPTNNSGAHQHASHHHHHHHHYHREYPPSPEWWKLYDIQDAAPWLRFNRYIHTGYRPQLTRWDACKTFFTLHNETVNIWSHLVPALMFLALFLYPPAMFADPLIRVCVASFVFIFTASAIYHGFMPCCASAEGYRRLICGDVVGALCSISVTAFSFILRGNRCLSPMQTTITVCVFGGYSLLLLYVIILGKMTVGQRFGLFGTHCFLRLMVCVYVTQGKIEAQPELRLGTYYHAMGFFTLLTGGLLNVTRFPESFMRRRWAWLDYIGNSHNIWHYMCVHSCLMALAGCWFDKHEYTQTDCALQGGVANW